MSDTNRVGVAVRRVAGQSAFPVTLGGNLQNLRITGAPSLAFTPSTIVSDEIRPDRQRSDLIPVGAEAGGEVSFEYSYGAVDELIESSLFSTWDNTHEATPDAGVMGAGTIPFAVTTGFVVGQLIRLIDPSAAPAGFDNTTGIYSITTVTASTSITVSPYDINSIDSSQTNAPAITSSFESDANTTVKVVGVLGASGDISFDATGIASAAGIFDDLLRKATGTTDILPGHFIRIRGSDATVRSTNDVWVQVTGVRATGAGLNLNVPSGWQTDAGTGDTVAIFFGDVVRNGAEALSSHQFVVEESFNDHAPVSYVTFLEMAVNQLNMNLDPQAIATGSVEFFGTTAQADTSEANLYGGAQTRDAAPAYNVYNTSSNVARLGRGADVVGSGGVNCVLQATVNLNNNLRRNNAVGVFGACAIGVGELAVSGNLSTYFDDLSLFTDLLNGAETSVDFGLRAIDGRTLLVDMPRIKYNGGAPQVPGKNQDVTLPLTYDAILDADLGYTISFQRFAYAA